MGTISVVHCPQDTHNSSLLLVSNPCLRGLQSRRYVAAEPGLPLVDSPRPIDYDVSLENGKRGVVPSRLLRAL